MSQQTLDDQLHELRLSAFRTALREQQANPHYADLTFEDRLALLVDAERMGEKNPGWRESFSD